MTPNEFLSKSRGTFVINKAVTKTIQFTAIEVLSNAVISDILDLDGRTSVISNYLTDRGSAIPAGAIIRSLPGKTFGSITLTSGTVQLILE